MKNIQIKTLLFALLCLMGWGSASAQVAELQGKLLAVSTTEATSITTSQWYVMKNRGRSMAHVYETPDQKLMMSADNLDDASAKEYCGHLIRFVSSGTAGKYYIQTGYGHYFKDLTQGDNNGAGAESARVLYTSGTIGSNTGHFCFADANGKVLDANPAGSSMAGWNNTLPTSTGGNNDWALYAVTLTKNEVVLPTIVPDTEGSSGISSTVNYNIMNVGCGKYLSINTSYTEGNAVNATPLSASPAAFTLTVSGGKYALKSGSAYVGLSTTSKMSGWNTKNYSTAQYIWTLEAAEVPDQYYIKSEKGYLKYDGTNDYAFTDGKNKEDNTRWIITPEVNTVSTFTENKYYRIRNYMDPTRFITSNAGAIYAYEGSDEKYDQIWQATKNGSNWQLMCVLDGQYIRDTKKDGAYATGTAGSTLVVTSKGEAADGRPYVMIAPANATSAYFNNSKGAQSFKVVSWQDINDDSSWWYLEQTPITAADVTAIGEIRERNAHNAEILDNADVYAATLATYFEDKACTKLKSTYASKTASALRSELEGKLPSELVEMVVNVRNDKWDTNATKSGYIKDFRIHSYDIYSDPAVWNKITNVGGFSSLFHPTGITCKADELLYIMVGEDPKDSDAKLELGIAEATHNGPSQRVELHAGLNVILPTVTGEAFVIYRLVNSEKYLNEYPNITIHIEGGEASGCFDMHRGHDNEDWDYLCSNMFTNKYLHIMGEHTVFSVETDRVRGAENITGSLKIWDFIFMTEEKLIGHDGQWNGRYNPVVGARDQYKGNPNWSGTSANYSGIWKDGLLNYNSLLNGDRWVIYHEEAHGHQYPVNLAATTESSNNGFAQMVNHEFGLTSRRADGTKTLVTFKNDGLTWVDMLRGGEGANRGRKYYEEALWVQNHVFYQLYLYFHAAGHMPDFWPRLCDEMRSNGGLKKSADRNNPTKYYEDYLLFAKACAKVSKTDLYEFFDAWGFFGYYDDVFVGNDLEAFSSKDIASTGTRYVGDYGSYYMRMPVRNNPEDERILQEIKDFMHAQPNKAPGIMFIDDHIKDRNVSPDCFAAQLDPTLAGKPVGFYDSWTKKQGDFGDFSDFNSETPASGIKLTTTGITGTGLVGVKVYDDKGNLKYIYNTNTFTLPDAAKTAVQNGTYKIVVVLGDGTQLPLNSKDFDMNLDGTFTIADVSLIVKALNVTTNTYTTNNLGTLRTKVLQAK